MYLQGRRHMPYLGSCWQTQEQFKLNNNYSELFSLLSYKHFYLWSWIISDDGAVYMCNTWHVGDNIVFIMCWISPIIFVFNYSLFGEVSLFIFIACVFCILFYISVMCRLFTKLCCIIVPSLWMLFIQSCFKRCWRVFTVYTWLTGVIHSYKPVIVHFLTHSLVSLCL